MLRADQAVKAGQGDREIIPERYIPHDELGSIMRSRNETVLALRRQEQALAAALSELQRVAADLQRKNYLLESAQRNLADADRLASLGMMSAGIAHELNTPLAVLKGTVEQLNQDPAALDAPRAALMLRVVQRLETVEEAGAEFELQELFSLVNVPVVGQVHLFYRAQLTSDQFNPGVETLEARLFAEDEIPWDEIAFQTVKHTLKRYFADRQAGQFRFHAIDLV